MSHNLSACQTQEIRMKDEEQRWFGVGCSHFGYRPQLPFEFRTELYIEALNAALKSLPSINKLSIDYDESFETRYHVDSAPLALNSGEGYFPCTVLEDRVLHLHPLQSARRGA